MFWVSLYDVFLENKRRRICEELPHSVLSTATRIFQMHSLLLSIRNSFDVYIFHTKIRSCGTNRTADGGAYQQIIYIYIFFVFLLYKKFSIKFVYFKIDLYFIVHTSFF